MDKKHYDEMVENLHQLEKTERLKNKRIYLFGHCNASEELIALLLEHDYGVCAILDNNKSKHGMKYMDIAILPPEEILKENPEDVIVCIVARAYAPMFRQLRKLGYLGDIEKLVDYNSYAEYSLAEDTIFKKKKRVERGNELLKRAKDKYPDMLRIYCPFQALGDIFYMMSYLPYFLQRKNIKDYVVYTIGESCADVPKLFGARYVEALSQKDIDEQIQAALFTGDELAFVPHQDRPYVQTVYKAFYVKKFTLEMIYKHGVFALPENCKPYEPTNFEVYPYLSSIPKGKALIIAPYAKSVTNIADDYWQQIIKSYKQKGYSVYTNLAPDEAALSNTLPLQIPINQLKSVVEWAGTFIGLRSGICDIIRSAACKKTALYPNAFYSDTKWKMEEVYHMDGWDNMVI